MSLGIGFDSGGLPKIDGIDRLIKHPPTRYYRFNVWTDGDDDNSEDKDYLVGEYGFEYLSDFELTEEEYERQDALDEIREKTGDDKILEGETYLEDKEVPYEPKDTIVVIRYLVESRGKLLMVRRLLQFPSYSNKYTRKVEVLEACTSRSVWEPVSDGLGGQALFISKPFCKSISVCGDVEKDTIYFVDTGETFNMKSQTMSPPYWNIDRRDLTWMFSPNLVV